MNFCFGLEDLLETAIFTLAAAELVTAGQLTQHHAVYSVQLTVSPVYKFASKSANNLAFSQDVWGGYYSALNFFNFLHQCQ
jgi:hypothetical protein